MKTLKMDGDSQNSQEALLELLKQNAPEVFSENKVDVKQLRATLGENVLVDTERYGLNWAGKMDCFRTIQETTTNTLKPARDESVDFDTTENLFIEGDNLEVLKVLQKSYYGKVKMIYIDPPYNTGNDFIYSDKFSRTKKAELIANGSIDDAGNVINHDLYRQNTKDGGHFHSNWLNMMYPRLFLAKNLLRQDGVIFVSIDDNEVTNLRMVMDEIFGEENFVADFIWNHRKSSQNDTDVSLSHNYTLAYAKNREIFTLNPLEINEAKFSNPDNDPRGPWVADPFDAPNIRPNLTYPIVNPNTSLEYLPPKGRCWRTTQEKFLEALADNRIIWGKNGISKPQMKRFLTEAEEKGTNPFTIWSDVGTATEGTKELMDLFDGNKYFDTPKPVSLIVKILKLSSNADSIVLDFFAGSGTTADAVMQLNAEDGGSRKYICVQLPEKCKPETEAAKAGYVTIADISRERIRRAGKKIREENPDKKIDIGFKAFKLDESNFKIWNTHVTSVEQLEQQMIEMFDNIQPGATKEAMIYELILKSGKGLNVVIEEKETEGEKFFKIDDGSIIICLADKLSLEIFMGMIAEKPKKIIVLDKSFGDDDQLKTNCLLRAEGKGIDEVRVI